MKGKSLPLFYDSENKKCQGVTYSRSGTKKLLILLIITSCFFYFFYGFVVSKNCSLRESTNDDLADYFIEGTPPPVLSEYLLTKESERLTRVVPVSHVFIASAYYYPTSNSLGNNAIALNLVLDSKNFDISNYKFSFVGSNKTRSVSGLAVSQVKESEKCRYTSAVALGNSVENLTKLELKSNGTIVEIPFKMSRYTSPKPVIICISPQFVAEQWQIFMMHVHTAHRFGAHMHIYVTFIVNSYFELMKEYEAQGYLTIEPWLRMKLEDPGSMFFEPNLNTEDGNRAGAYSDCLLQYREAVEYIAFFDMEDILFPLTYPTYLEEFHAEFTRNSSANSLLYRRREHEFRKFDTLDDYNFHKLADSLRTSTAIDGRFVVKPTLHNISWNHQENRIEVEYPYIIHLKSPYKINENEDPESRFNRFNGTIHQNDVIAIHDDAMQMKNNTVISRVANNLPISNFYTNLVSKCYLNLLDECPNIEKCSMPQRKDIKCMHTDAEYISGPSTEPLTFHFFKTPIWSSEYGCYQ